MTLHPDVQAFASLLQNIEAVLIAHGERHWAALVSRCLTFVEGSGAQGARLFLSFFGGMGSLNDLQLHRDGQPLPVENHQFLALLTQAWEAGRHLVRND